MSLEHGRKTSKGWTKLAMIPKIAELKSILKTKQAPRNFRICNCGVHIEDSDVVLASANFRSPDLEISVKLHNIKRVIGVVHRDCGAAAVAYGDKIKTDKAFETAQLTEVRDRLPGAARDADQRRPGADEPVTEFGAVP